MSKNETTIFSEATVTKNLQVTVAGIEVPKDDIQDIEIRFDMFSTTTYIYIIIKDTIGLYNMKSFEFSGNAKVQIQVTDAFENMYMITGRIVQSKTSPTARNTTLMFIAVDEASYLLDVMAKADSSTKSVCSTINDSLGECGATAILGADQISAKVTEPDEPLGQPGKPFIIPGNRSRLDFFTELLSYENAFMYRSHKALNIGPIVLGDLERVEEKFTTDTSNNYYMKKIHEYKIKTPKKVTIPKLKMIRYEGKEQKVDEVSIKDIADSAILNGNKDAFLDVQEVDANAAMDATVVEPAVQKNTLFKQLILTNQMSIWVVGNYKDNDIGKIVETKLSSDVYTNETQLQGNISASGFWLVTSLTDKISGDKFIQKMILSRFDNPKPIN